MVLDMARSSLNYRFRKQGDRVPPMSDIRDSIYDQTPDLSHLKGVRVIAAMSGGD